MEITKKAINSDLAKQLLGDNDGNRNVKPERVIRYSNQMKQGLWKQDTGETIKISKTMKGILQNGLPTDNCNNVQKRHFKQQL